VGGGNEPVVAVAAALSPAVVQIQTGEGLGSGIVYDASGLIVTNQHVVGSAKTVGVTLADGTRFDGQVAGADADHDIAVVRIKPGATKLQAAKLATKPPLVGSITVAIGSPFGLSGTVTSGVVSALDRPVTNGREVAVAMIQTDAPINPGNSGGALANRNGEVIGVNAEIVSESGSNSGIGFAIPIDTAMEIAHKITAGQSLARPALGVAVRDATGNLVGAQVVSVTADSAASKAGLKASDVIVALDAQKITSSNQFRALLGRDEPGQTVRITVDRGGKTVTLSATLGKAS
jgi:S1-C subfamily serine protease